MNEGNQKDHPLGNEIKSESIKKIDLKILDSNLILLSNRITSRGFSHFNLKIWPKFNIQKDTIFHSDKDSILLFEYDTSQLLDFYLTPPYAPSHFRDSSKLESITELLIFLRKAKRCTGFEYGTEFHTVSNMVESWEFNNETDAQYADSLFHFIDYQLFPKTLSFSASDSEYFYIFHSRFMGASWELKKDYEWFNEKIK